MQKYLLALLLGSSSVLIFLPDLFRNTETVKDIIGHSSGFLSCILLVVLVLYRVAFKDISIPNVYKKTMLAIFIGTFLVTSVLTLINSFTFANFVYSKIYLHLEMLMYLSLASGISWLLFQERQFFKKYSFHLHFVIPFFILVIGLLMLLMPPHGLQRMTREDSIVEYLQVFVLIFGSISSIIVAKKIAFKNPLSFVFIFSSIALFFIAGDEISWGQRLLNLDVPSEIKTLNTQGEITVHNLHYFDGYVPFGYLLLGLYGSVASLAVRNLKLFSKRIREHLFPGNKFFALFFLSALYSGYTTFFDHSIGNFSEPAELLLYSGISLFIMELSRKKVVN